MPHYVASKGAIMAFTRSMARELGPYNINVNSIAPSFTHSLGRDEFDNKKALLIGPLDGIQLSLRCLKRAAYPEDLVGTAIFRTSDDNNFITGQLIVHNGGMSFH
jgi:NAD(P)-dependent dehydrogenase (short-subunit alcohol dehydrogenase family)